MYPYWSEQMIAMHHKELLRQAERDRLATIYLRHHTHPLRHSLAMCGVVLVKVGMSLKQLEARSEPQAV
jgi:hypothetical protein